MDQLGIGCCSSAMGLGLDRLHDLRLEGRQLRQDLRLAWGRHPPVSLVLSDGLCPPRRGGTERGDRTSNHARRGAPLTVTLLFPTCTRTRMLSGRLDLGNDCNDD